MSGMGGLRLLPRLRLTLGQPSGTVLIRPWRREPRSGHALVAQVLARAGRAARRVAPSQFRARDPGCREGARPSAWSPHSSVCRLERTRAPVARCAGATQFASVVVGRRRRGVVWAAGLTASTDAADLRRGFAFTGTAMISARRFGSVFVSSSLAVCQCASACPCARPARSHSSYARSRMRCSRSFDMTFSC
jgi:hypothetical protein